MATWYSLQTSSQILLNTWTQSHVNRRSCYLIDSPGSGYCMLYQTKLSLVFHACIFLVTYVYVVSRSPSSCIDSQKNTASILKYIHTITSCTLRYSRLIVGHAYGPKYFAFAFLSSTMVFVHVSLSSWSIPVVNLLLSHFFVGKLDIHHEIESDHFALIRFALEITL